MDQKVQFSYLKNKTVIIQKNRKVKIMYWAGCSGVGGGGWGGFIHNCARWPINTLFCYIWKLLQGERCATSPLNHAICAQSHFQTAAVRFNHEEFQRQLVQYLEGWHLIVHIAWQHNYPIWNRDWLMFLIHLTYMCIWRQTHQKCFLIRISITEWQM